MNNSILKFIISAVVLGTLATSSRGYNGPPPFSNIEILADTNRDGVVDSSDASGKQNWTKTLGAIYTVNYDADGGLYNGAIRVPDAINFGDNGRVDFEDFLIDSVPDKADIATIRIKNISDMPAGARVFLVLDSEVEMRAVHIYKKIKTKGEDVSNKAIWGGRHIATQTPVPWTDGDSEVRDIEVTKWLNPNCGGSVYEETRDDTSDPYYTFGIEGVLLAGMEYFGTTTQMFDGTIHLKVEIRDSDGTTVCAEDHIVMRVAPWLTLSADRSSQQVWAENAGDSNRTFRNPDPVPPPTAKYVGLTHSGQLHSTLTGDSQWLQDHVEIGYTQMPRRPAKHLVFRLPYQGSMLWPVEQMLSAGVGVFQLGTNLYTDTEKLDNGGYVAGDFGGNLETMLPSTTYPLGRVAMGNTGSAKLKAFLNAQGLGGVGFQTPNFSISCDWLKVGHIDEVAVFLPKYGSPAQPRILMADSQAAISLLETNFTTDEVRRKRLFFAYGPSLTVASDILVAQVTATNSDPNIIQTGINHTAAGSPNFKYIRFLSGNNIGMVCHVTRHNTYLQVTPVPGHSNDGSWDTGRDIDEYCTLLQSTVGGIQTPAPGSKEHEPAAVGDKFVMVEDTLWWSDKGESTGFPAVVSVFEILAQKNGEDNLFVGRNRVKVQEKLTAISNALLTASGTPAAHITPVPCLYFGKIETAALKKRSWLAFMPNAVNLQQINGNLYAPRQFGPRNGDGPAGNDIFETAITNSVPGSVPVKFVDDWDWYHAQDGEVHCGSNVKRSFPAAGKEWWNFTP